MRLRQLSRGIVIIAASFALACSPDGIMTTPQELQGPPKLDVRPITFAEFDYMYNLMADYANIHGWSGPCQDALWHFFSEWDATYTNEDDPAFGRTFVQTGKIQMNRQRLGDPLEDLDTMFHEAYHSMNLGDYNDQNASNFASSCMW